MHLARDQRRLFNLITTSSFLFQLMSAIKTGEVANVRMGSIVQQTQRKPPPKISVDRSGGGL